MERTILLVLAILCSLSNHDVNAFVSIANVGKQQQLQQKQQQQHHRLIQSYSESATNLYMSIPTPIDTLTSGLVSICRLPGGVSVLDEKTSINTIPETDRQLRIKVLYDIENSLPCRKVRELITELDLVVDNVVPACKNSQVFTNSNYKYKLDDDMIIPRMIVTTDGSDTEMTLSGDDEIVSYLKEKFGLINDSSNYDTKQQIVSILREFGGYVATVLRIGRGSDVASTSIGAPKPIIPLVLYSYEGNQFCRLVREVLTELDIVYELRSTGKGSLRRNELAALTGGSTQCPYLVDPNTNIAMAESIDIIKYLYTTYGKWVPPNELLQWTSQYVVSLAKPIFTLLTPLQAGSSNSDNPTYQAELDKAREIIQKEITSSTVVVYTYSLSPFSFETIALLNNLNITYTEISVGLEWIPGLIAKDGGSQKRAALLEMTGQSSLPHIFVNGQSIGGLFSGTPGLIPALEQDIFIPMIQDAIEKSKSVVSTSSDFQ